MKNNRPAMRKGIFITGTDTGVGKTHIAVLLIRELKGRGLTVCPMKPAESGCRVRQGNLIPADTVRLLKVSEVEERLDAVNPYRMKAPLAPAVAAQREGLVIRRKTLVRAFSSLSARYDLTVVEGAGGVMVPLYRKYLYLDLIKDLSLPVLVVSRPGLGTINHTLLTIAALKQAGCTIAGVVINYAENMRRGAAEKTNPATITSLTGVPLIGVVPFGKKRGGRQAASIADALSEILGLDA